MKINILETLTGAIVVGLSVVLLFFGYTSTKHGSAEGYTIKAKFSKADGLIEGSNVKVAGIKVGSVTKLTLDQTTYGAMIEMRIDKNVKLPTDSSAAIISESLLGGKYMDLQAGGDESMIEDGGVIQHTQSSVILESLIGQLIFSSKDGKSKDAKA